MKTLHIKAFVPSKEFEPWNAFHRIRDFRMVDLSGNELAFGEAMGA